MLRFERKKSGKITLSVKQRTKLWTFDFIIALGIALLIHGIGLFFFRIDFEGFLNSKNYLSTLRVSSEQNGSPFDFYEQESSLLEIPSYLIINQQEAPLLSLISLASTIMPKEPPLDLNGIEIKSSYKPVSSRFFLSKGCKFLEGPEQIQAKKISKAKLEFKAHPETGIIFWVNWIYKTGDLKCDLEIVEKLKKTKLLPSYSTLAMDGVIEVEFGS